MKKKKRYSFKTKEIWDIYNRLVDADIVTLNDIKNQTQFARLFRQSPARIRWLLTTIYNEKTQNLHSLIESPHEGSIFLGSKDAFSISKGVNEKTLKAELKLHAFKKISKWYGKWTEIKPSEITYHTPEEEKSGKKFVKADKGYEITGAIFDDYMKIAEDFYALMRYISNKKQMIDSHGTNSWDKIMLWYASYSSTKGDKGGFKGYVITWHKVLDTVSEKGRAIINKYNAMIAENPEYHITHFDEPFNAFIEFNEALSHLVNVEEPVGKQYPLHLGQVRKLSEDELGGGYGVEIFDALAPIIMVGHDYVKRMGNVYNAAKVCKNSITRKHSRRGRGLSKGWENRILARTISGVDPTDL